MSRPSCLQCARKHIAEAEVLMREAIMGYAEHAWYAVGHLSQAEAELIEDYIDMAHIIRAERINYIEGLEYKLIEEDLNLTTTYNINTLNLIRSLTILSIESEQAITD